MLKSQGSWTLAEESTIHTLLHTWAYRLLQVRVALTDGTEKHPHTQAQFHSVGLPTTDGCDIIRIWTCDLLMILLFSCTTLEDCPIWNYCWSKSNRSSSLFPNPAWTLQSLSFLNHFCPITHNESFAIFSVCNSVSFAFIRACVLNPFLSCTTLLTWSLDHSLFFSISEWVLIQR